MKVIIAGSRTIKEYNAVRLAIKNALWEWKLTYEDVSEIVSGCANGVDRLGEEWAYRNNKAIKKSPAEWEKYDKSAGFKRNEQMAQYGDVLIAIWDGKSKGTQHMINLAKKYNLNTYVFKV